jgi:hypothetical protein
MRLSKHRPAPPRVVPTGNRTNRSHHANHRDSHTPGAVLRRITTDHAERVTRDESVSRAVLVVRHCFT